MRNPFLVIKLTPYFGASLIVFLNSDHLISKDFAASGYISALKANDDPILSDSRGNLNKIL